MDRRNIWRVAGRGAGGTLVQSGSVSQLPAAGQAGRLYVVSPIATTSMGGSVFAAAWTDTGSAWTRPASVVYQSPVVTLLTGAATKIMANIWLKPNTLMSGRRIDLYMIGRYNGGTATTITITPRLVIGTVSWTSLTNTITSSASAVQDLHFEARLVGGSTASLGYVQGFLGGQSTPASLFGFGTASRVFNPSVSQNVKISITLNKNIANTAFRSRYIGAMWR